MYIDICFQTEISVALILVLFYHCMYIHFCIQYLFFVNRYKLFTIVFRVTYLYLSLFNIIGAMFIAISCIFFIDRADDGYMFDIRNVLKEK